MVADFTSSLYLGLGHPRDSLDDWAQLTTGAPAVLGESPAVRKVGTAVAQLVGCETAVVAASTLHLAWDVAALIESMHAAVLVDQSAYPILRVAADIARGRGALVRKILGHDGQTLREAAPRGSPVVVITDGYCPACRRVTPIAEYAAVARETGGFVVVDDTQALGILGSHPTRDAPFGRGGGGSLAWTASPSDGVVIVASLAKAFGTPLAVAAGDGERMRRFTATSMTRTHSSPPSRAALEGARRALLVNRAHGERLRSRLLSVVKCFRSRMSSAGVLLAPGLFPVQALSAPTGLAARELQHQLDRAGVRAVLTGAARSARLVFILTTRHTECDIAHATAATASALTRISSSSRPLPAEAQWQPRNQALSPI